MIPSSSAPSTSIRYGSQSGCATGLGPDRSPSSSACSLRRRGPRGRHPVRRHGPRASTRASEWQTRRPGGPCGWSRRCRPGKQQPVTRSTMPMRSGPVTVSTKFFCMERFSLSEPNCEVVRTITPPHRTGDNPTSYPFAARTDILSPRRRPQIHSGARFGASASRPTRALDPRYLIADNMTNVIELGRARTCISACFSAAR